MKATRLISHLGSLAVFSVFIDQPATLRAQGGLTPPGAPAPTMKSLDQIYSKLDVRAPITNTASAVTISAPGSYFLTGNLTVSSGNAITIATNSVTLDLNGFSISSTEANPTATGLLINNSLSDLTIINGHIRSGVTNNGSGVYSGSGFSNGIAYFNYAPANVLVSHVSINGVLNDGINLGNNNSTMVESCTVRTLGGLGIEASTVRSSLVFDCGAIAIFGDDVSDSRGQSTGSGMGLLAVNAQNCYGLSGSGDGLHANNALNCYGFSASGYGINTYSAQNCWGVSSTSTGLKAYNASFCTGSH
ncbi:MAG TPA: hypothetical protein VMB80_06060, partial [Candidatus Acidoferrum sp.]|nr:hypothetical protein [Candidatus Acidoferrum sp.]